jgi:hypothetical protein
VLNIQPKQWLQIIGGSVSGLITGAALLNPIFGQELSLQIVAGLGIFNIIISSVATAVSGQAQLVKDVRAMPGVEKVLINENANPTLAAVAIDPDEPKVGATTPDVREILKETAKG